MGCRSWAPAGRIVKSVAHFACVAWVAVVAWTIVCPIAISIPASLVHF